MNARKIVTYTRPHTCINNVLSSDHRHLDSPLMSRDVQQMVKEDVTVKVRVLQAHIESKYGYRPSYRKTWIAKDKAIQNLYGKWDESYGRLPQFFSVLQSTNPGTVVEWDFFRLTAEGSGIIFTSEDIFQRVFWAFGPCIRALKFCRPVLTVDGTFLFGKYKGTLLVASGIDADNHIIPVAFAIVESENYSSWGWFLRNVRAHITRTRHITIISDRHNGLVEVMNNNTIWRTEEAVHRYCTRHVASNVAKHCKNNAIQDTVKRIAGRFEVHKFTKDMEELQDSHPECVSYLNTIPLSQWTAAHDGGYRYGIMTTNFVECINGVLKGVRHLPITAVVEDTFNRCVSYFYKRRADYATQVSEGHRFPRKVRKILDQRTRKSTSHAVQAFNRDLGLCKVITGNHEHVVTLQDGSCTCGKFQALRIPCTHATAACREFGVDQMSYVSVWYSLNHCQKAYEANFYPMGDKAYWPAYGGRQLVANASMIRRIPGRPRTTRYHNEMDANPSRIVCGSCGQQGHNRRTCRNRIR